MLKKSFQYFHGLTLIFILLIFNIDAYAFTQAILMQLFETNVICWLCSLVRFDCLPHTKTLCMSSVLTGHKLQRVWCHAEPNSYHLTNICCNITSVNTIHGRYYNAKPVYSTWRTPATRWNWYEQTYTLSISVCTSLHLCNTEWNPFHI